jgi:hypothetical protein
MFIETNSNYPVESQRNQRIHVPRSVAEVAVGFGQATYCPRPNYGSAAWVEERQIADAQRGVINGDVNPIQVEESWGVADKTSAVSVVRVVRRKGNEITWFDSPPPNCPRSVAAQWQRLHISGSPQQQAANDAVKEKALRDEAQNKEKVTGGYGRVIFLGK